MINQSELIKLVKDYVNPCHMRKNNVINQFDTSVNELHKFVINHVALCNNAKDQPMHFWDNAVQSEEVITKINHFVFNNSVLIVNYYDQSWVC